MHVVDFVDPFRGWLVRRMCAPRHVIKEEWLIGSRSIEGLEVIDGIIGHCRRQIPARLPHPWKDLCGVAEEVWRPLVSLAAHEAIEIFKAHPHRPLVKGPRETVLKAWRVVLLTEP